MKTRVGFNTPESLENIRKNPQRVQDIVKIIDEWEDADLIAPTRTRNVAVIWSKDETGVTTIRDWADSPVEKVNEYLTLARSIGADFAEIIVE